MSAARNVVVPAWIIALLLAAGSVVVAGELAELRGMSGGIVMAYWLAVAIGGLVSVVLVVQARGVKAWKETAEAYRDNVEALRGRVSELERAMESLRKENTVLASQVEELRKRTDVGPLVAMIEAHNRESMQRLDSIMESTATIVKEVRLVCQELRAGRH